MNDEELNRILKSARVPEPSKNYWAQFPKRVMAKIKHRMPLPGIKRKEPKDNRSRHQFHEFSQML